MEETLGDVLASMPTRPSDPSTPALQLLELAYAHIPARAVYAAVKLGVANAIHDGHDDIDSLAAAVGVRADMLYRIMRLLAGLGVFREEADRRFALTPLSDTLLAGSSQSTAAFVEFLHAPEIWRACEVVLHTLRTGETAFDHVHEKGQFDHIRDDAAFGDVFHRAMTSLSRASAQAAVNAYDFSAWRRIVDVGGGNGTFLSLALAAHPSLSAILFDRADAIEQARQGVGGPLPRCEFVVGDFFASVPEGCDIYFLKHILHDWDDERALQICTCCRNAMSGDARLLVMERYIGAANLPWPGHRGDLLMAFLTGGRARTPEEYAALFAAAGLRLTKVLPAGVDYAFYEAKLEQ